MGLFDKLKRNRNQDDEDPDELDDLDDIDLDLDDDGEGSPSASSGGGMFGRAMGLLRRGKGQAEDDEDDDEDDEVIVDSIDDDDEDDDDGDGGRAGEKGVGRFGGLLSRVKKIRGGRKKPKNQDDDDDETGPDSSDEPDEDGDEEEQPIRRSGIAAALDGESEEGKPIGGGEGAGREGVLAGLGMDLESLFEEEFVFDPTLKDLAESMEEVSAVELAADLRSFLEELQ